MENKNSFGKILKSYLMENAFYLVVLLFATVLIALGISFIANIPYKAPIILCAVIVYFIIEISHFVKYFIAHRSDDPDDTDK